MLDETYSRLKELVIERYRANWDKSLADAYSLSPDFLSVGQEGVAFLLASREELLRVFADPLSFDALVDLFVEMTLEFSYKCNQFIRATGPERDQLVDIYRSYLRRMDGLIAVAEAVEALTRDLEALVRDHFVELRQHLDRLSGGDLPSTAAANPFLAPAVCREYSPDLQLGLLAIDPSRLLGPVLDIGCGREGKLVQQLRALGIDAFGVDRIVEPLSHLVRADWLDMPLEPGRWGTIISHMAFSNHFVFQHLYRFGTPEQYARQYRVILESLRPGGSFFYAPGLPFVEKYLPQERFSVTTRGVKLSASDRSRARPSQAAVALYSTQVTRVNRSSAGILECVRTPCQA